MYLELTPDISDEHEQIKSMVHAFSRDVLRPAARTLDTIPADEVGSHPVYRDAMQQAYELNLHALLVPEGFGGMGLDPLATHIAFEEMGWGSAGFAISIAVSQFPAFGACLLATDNDELIGEFTAPFVENKDASVIGCWAITEPDHGSDWLVEGNAETDRTANPLDPARRKVGSIGLALPYNEVAILDGG